MGLISLVKRVIRSGSLTCDNAAKYLIWSQWGTATRGCALFLSKPTSEHINNEQASYVWMLHLVNSFLVAVGAIEKQVQSYEWLGDR